MSHVYTMPIRVWHRKRRPTALQWRGVRYQVRAVLAQWRLTHRWWVTAAEADANGGKGHTDRTYYRLCCQEAGVDWDMLCEVYHDAVTNVWVMERVLD